MVEADAASHNIIREEAERLGSQLGEDRSFAALRMTGGALFGMVGEVLLGGVVVAAGGFVVAAADGFVQGVAIFIDIEREAAFAPTVWTGVAGRYAAVFL